MDTQRKTTGSSRFRTKAPNNKETKIQVITVHSVLQCHFNYLDLTLDLSPSSCCKSTLGSTVSPFRM